MFNIKRALLSALILSGLTIQTTQPMFQSIKQKTSAIFEMLLNHKGKTACCLLIGAVLAYKIFTKSANVPNAPNNVPNAPNDVLNWTRAVQRLHPNGIEQLDSLNLDNNQIAEIPANLNLPQLYMLYLDNNQINAIPENLNLPQLRTLHLDNNQINAIPENLNLPQLQWLCLHNNHITYVDPQILQQFSRLNRLYLNQNPLTQQNVDELRNAAVAAGRELEIIADNLIIPHGRNIKGAAKR